MQEYRRPTDQTHKIKLPSVINQAMWDRTAASIEEEVEFEVFTHFVSDGAEMKISIHNRSGKKLDELTGKVFGNRTRGRYIIPDNAKDAIYFEAELKKHGLKKKSEDMVIIPPIFVTNARWSQPITHRLDILTLTADVIGANDGTEGWIEIYENDPQGAHELIIKFSIIVEGNRVESQWMFDYPGDTNDIPTAAESELGYIPPKYFFKVIVRRKFAQSDLLEFKDWIEIELKADDDSPIGNKKYILHLPDGNDKNGTLNANGYAREDDLPPGKVVIEFPEMPAVEIADVF